MQWTSKSSPKCQRPIKKNSKSIFLPHDILLLTSCLLRSNFPPWASSNSSQWFGNSHDTCLPLYAPIISPIGMDLSNSQIQPLGGYFQPCHVIVFIGLQSGLNLSQNLSSLVGIECMEAPSKWHTLSSSLFLFHGSYYPLLIRIPWLIICYLTPHHPPITLHYPCVQIWIEIIPSVWEIQ